MAGLAGVAHATSNSWTSFYRVTIVHEHCLQAIFSAMPRQLSDKQFAQLLEFRVALRKFSHWSEAQAAAVGLTSAQHQLLVAIRGHGDPRGPTITDVADYLLIRHHSAIGLIGRAEELGLVRRTRDDEDQRLVRLRLTDLGHRRVNQLAALHLSELRNLAPLLEALVAVAGDTTTSR